MTIRQHYNKHIQLYAQLHTSYNELIQIIDEYYKVKNRIQWKKLEEDTIKQEIDDGLMDSQQLIYLIKKDAKTYLDAITEYLYCTCYYDIIDNYISDYENLDDLEYNLKKDLRHFILFNPRLIERLVD